MAGKPATASATSTRRQFLHRSAAVATGIAAFGTLAAPGRVHAAGDDMLKVGLIGCGGRGSGAALNALNAHPGNRLVAMADLFEDKVRGSRDRLKKLKPDQVQVDDDHCFVGFEGYRHVIASADVVVIACASRFHPQYLKAAIDAGKHVFVEKPHALDPPGIRLVQATCDEAEKKGLAVVSGLCWRYHYGVRETIQRVLDGAIGQIVAVQENYMRSPYHLHEHTPGQSEIEYQYRNWYHFNWLSGDDICQSLIHSMDKGSWVLGDRPPVAAYGQGGRAASHGRMYGDVFDHFSIVYEYDDGARMYGVGRAQTNCYNEVSDLLIGTKGRCNVIKHRITGEVNWQYEGPKCNMYDVEHQELFASIRAGKPINNGRYMVISSMLAILGRMVAYSGKRITWEEAIASNDRLGPEHCDFDTEPPVKPDKDGIYPVPVPGLSKPI